MNASLLQSQLVSIRSQAVSAGRLQSLVVSIILTLSLAVNASPKLSLLVFSSLFGQLAISAGRLQSLVVSIILIWSLAVSSRRKLFNSSLCSLIAARGL